MAMPLSSEQIKIIEMVAENYQNISSELKKRIVGLENIIEQLMICIFSGNHALLVGVPGLAKTLLIRSLSELLDLQFSRIQFTPDLMPSDITGTEILMQQQQQSSRIFNFLKGPVFANIILADEINRTPPKTQSALLEAMEEHTVTSSGRCFHLDKPFFVLATQNPIEQEGTYPLPAAQLDRFMFNLLLDYPYQQQEHHIMRLTISSTPAQLKPILDREQILRLMTIVRKIDIPPQIMRYATHLVRMSRPQNEKAPEVIKENISWGCSPRAIQGLIIGGKARAMLAGRTHVTTEDIRAIVHPVMRHRIILNYRAEADGTTPDEIIDRLLEIVPSPDGKKHILKRRQYSQKLYLSIANR